MKTMFAKPGLFIALLLPSLLAGQEVGTVDNLRENQLFDVTLTAVRPTQPALQNRLYPAVNQLLDRDASTFYHRAVMLMRSIDSGIREQNLRLENKIPYLYSDTNLWLDSPLDEMPVDDMRNWLDRHQDFLVELQRGVNSRHCNWGILPDPSEDINALSVRLEELQQMRSVCRVLLVAIRVAAFDRDYEQAIRYLRMGYKIAHDVSESRILIASLIGIACSGMMMEQQVMLMQQPDAPNLYWPMVDLPDPLTNVREALRYELGWLHGPNCMLKSLRDPVNATITAEGWREMMIEDFGTLFEFGGLGESAIEPMVGLFALRGYPIAKQSLLERGFEQELVEQMPAMQVLAIHESHINEIICHEYLKSLNLPQSQLEENFEALVERSEMTLMSPATSGIESVHEYSLFPFLGYLTPGYRQVLEAENRISRSMAALGVLEALRAHLALTGELPATLDDITIVPVPRNPATSNPFEYQQNADGASLKDYGYGKHTWKYYQIRLAK